MTTIQCISITCNNMSPNDMMMVSLGERLANFDGSQACRRCFGHIINPVARSLLHLFDPPKPKKKKKSKKKGSAKGKKKATESSNDEDNAPNNTCGVEDESDDKDPIDIEDLLAQLREIKLGITDKDNPDNISDKLAEMMAKAKKVFFAEIKAVHKALKKVHYFSCCQSVNSVEYILTFALCPDPNYFLPHHQLVDHTRPSLGRHRC